MNSINALSCASSLGSLSTIYVCNTPISDSVSLSTSEEVSVSDSACTPLKVPWHKDGKLPCLADQTHSVLFMNDDIDFTKDAKCSDLVTNNEWSDMVTEKALSDLVINKEHSNLVASKDLSDLVTEKEKHGIEFFFSKSCQR